MWQYPTWIPTIQAQTLSRELFWSKFNCDRMQAIIYKFSPLIHCHDTVTLLSLLFKQIKTITVFKLWPHGFHFGFMVFISPNLDLSSFSQRDFVYRYFILNHSVKFQENKLKWKWNTQTTLAVTDYDYHIFWPYTKSSGTEISRGWAAWPSD